MDMVEVEWKSEGSNKIAYAQTMLLDTDIKKLKAKTGSTNISDALAMAVKHYLRCGKNGDLCGCISCRRHDGETGVCGLIRAVPRNPQFCEVGIR